MSVIATNTGAENDEELNLPKKMWDKLRESGGFEALDHEQGSDADDESSEHES